MRRREVCALPEDVPEELAELVSELEGVGPEQALTVKTWQARFERAQKMKH